MPADRKCKEHTVTVSGPSAADSLPLEPLTPENAARLASLKQAGGEAIAVQRDTLVRLSRRIHGNPELAFQEVQASAWLADYLGANGFQVQRGACDLPTAFVATRSAGPGPVVAICAEYDALPGVGHGCGHNVIATAGVGAGVGVAAVLAQTGGTVRVLGTPAEESGGGKILMVERGAFDGADLAMMVHPAGIETVELPVIAMAELEVEFHGRAAHASATPEQGVNALDAMITAYNAIAQLRQHIPATARVHGIITDGGQAPNIVPAHSAGRFYVRAATERSLEPLKERVLACFRAGAEASGARLEYRWVGCSYSELWSNPVLAAAYVENARTVGRDPLPSDRIGRFSGSTDMGNVSKRLPAIHPLISISDTPIPGHSIEMAACAGSDLGDKAVVDGATMLAMTAIDALARPGFVDAARRAYEERRAADKEQSAQG
jgi:amidohydrolase